jgi:hypothetical protein
MTKTTREYSQAESEIANITGDLRNYSRAETSDSVRIQRLRAIDLLLASARLAKLVWNVKELDPPGRLALVIGDEPLDVVYRLRQPYDMSTSHHRTLGQEIGPRNALVFDDADRWIRDQDGDKEVYLRDGSMYLSTSGIAKALMQNGTLAVIEDDLADKVSRATWQASF